jgi:RNA polymerase sigma-B factor
MQKEHGEDQAHEVSSHVQELMEAYLERRDEPTRQQVVGGMAPIVEAIARRYARTRDAGSEPVEDLISEGYIGLLTAVDQYRPDRGARFSTYATHRVHGQIRHYLRDRGSRRLIRAPSWLQELTARLQKEEAKLLVEQGRPGTVAELAERLNLREEAVEELQAKGAGPAVLSLTERGSDDEEGGSIDLSKIGNQHCVSWQLPVEDHIFLEGLLARLKELERKVIQLFFFQDLNQSDIARSLDISCNYVGYLLNNGLKRLRKLIETDELRDAHLRISYAPRHMAGEASVIDPASGLYNADYFQGRLSEEVARACRYHWELGLVVLRVPLPVLRRLDAPALNGASDLASSEAESVAVVSAGAAGRRGRPRKRAVANPSSPVGALPADRDQVLQEVGVALRECLRKADIPARVGEGLLAIALPQTGPGAAAVAERLAPLLSQIAGCPVSCGIACYPADGREPAALLDIAVERAIEERAAVPEARLAPAFASV